MIIRTLALWFISLEFFFVAAAPTVTIANGTLHGVSDRLNGVDKFFGVPYAQPPVGALRLRQAIPLTEEFGEIDATSFGPSCYGRQNPNPNEDCLTLNIWRSSSIEEQLPVFVWFYGGSLSNGYTVCSSCFLLVMRHTFEYQRRSFLGNEM
jgi:carboxylesterase type B